MAVKLCSDIMNSFDSIVCVDGSYVIYHTLFSAVNTWKDESAFSDELTNRSEDDEQVELLKFSDFRDTLKGKVISTLERIKSIVYDFNLTTGSKTSGDILFVLDPPRNSKLRSWRYLVYEDYKGQRKATRDTLGYNTRSIFNWVEDLLIDDTEMMKRFGMKVIYSDGCEGDDIIAAYFMHDENSNFQKLLIASDHDYLQLKDVTQMTLEKNQVVIEQPYPDMIKVTPELYLLAKIITGDKSDNIPQVFNRVGYKTAVKKFLTDIELLTETIEHDKVAKEKFMKNTKLIDFNQMPKVIRQRSLEAIYG